MLDKKSRITDKKDFQKVYRSGRKITGNLFILRFAPNRLPQPRFGLVVSNKVSKKAVVRNRLKRQIRSKIQNDWQTQLPRYDHILYCRPGRLAGKNYSQISADLDQIFSRVK